MVLGHMHGFRNGIYNGVNDGHDYTFKSKIEEKTWIDIEPYGSTFINRYQLCIID